MGWRFSVLISQIFTKSKMISKPYGWWIIFSSLTLDLQIKRWSPLSTLSLSRRTTFLVPPFLTCTTKSHHALYTGRNYPHSLLIPLLKRKFRLDNFFPRAAILWNSLPRRWAQEWKSKWYNSKLNNQCLNFRG